MKSYTIQVMSSYGTLRMALWLHSAFSSRPMRLITLFQAFQHPEVSSRIPRHRSIELQRNSQCELHEGLANHLIAGKILSLSPICRAFNFECFNFESEIESEIEFTGCYSPKTVQTAKFLLGSALS